MTCTHGLGHLLLHKDALTKRDYLIEMEIFDITDQWEPEANRFAANNLIDDKELLDLLRVGYDVVQITSLLKINVNMLMVKLLTMNQKRVSLQCSLFAESDIYGTKKDRADSI